jgi:excisionase family DNA binding protein
MVKLGEEGNLAGFESKGFVQRKGMDKMKDLFTTGEAADVCKVSQQTIIRCFDAGRLEGFRVPGSKFRRIPRRSLIKFMKDNNIPLDAVDSGKRKVLIVDDDAEIVELLVDVLTRDGRFETKTASSARSDTARLYAARCQRQRRLPDDKKKSRIRKHQDYYRKRGRKTG